MRTPRIKVKLRYPNSETLVHAIPDTGAEVNIGGTKLLDQLQLCERDLCDGPYSKLVAANGSLFKKLGTLPITITLNKTSIKDNIVICEGQNELLLSWKTCSDLTVIPDNFPKQIGKINVNPVTLKDRSQSSMLKQKLLQEYKEVFDCNNHLPCMNGDPMQIHTYKKKLHHMQYMGPGQYYLHFKKKQKNVYRNNRSTRRQTNRLVSPDGRSCKTKWRSQNICGFTEIK